MTQDPSASCEQTTRGHLKRIQQVCHKMGFYERMEGCIGVRVLLAAGRVRVL
jgi:hypothetical protein